MPTIGPYFVAFSLTITNTASGPFQLYPILATGTAPTGITLGATPAVLFTAQAISSITFQNDPTNANGVLVYLGDSTLTSTNKGYTILGSTPYTFTPARGQHAWANGIYFNASANSTVINITVVYS